MRYEDLMIKKEDVLTELFTFAMEQSIEGTYLQERIKQVTKDEKGGKSYKPRSGGTNNLRYFNEELLEYMRVQLREVNIFFGYHKGERNPNSVFEYTDLTEEEKKMEYGFEKANESMKEVLKLDKAAIKGIDFIDDPSIITVEAYKHYRKGINDHIMKFVIKE
mmetsp:Transcript_29040/g.28007  ORF Transcript_29040/g.28007 Transcript_29040/m.28007 type:complete len:163 (+) Transcript_29040:521-1009(+)